MAPPTTPRPSPRRPAWVAALLLLAAGGAACAAARATPADAPAPSLAAIAEARDADWIPLFNGRDLDGWIPKFATAEAGENVAETFRVVDGTLQARYDGYGGDYGGRFGHLYTERAYSHYVVSLEYRLVGELYPGAPDYTMRNSGIMLHAQHPRTMPRDQNFPISVEMQFYEGLGDGRPRPTGNLCTPGTIVDYDGRTDPRHCITSSGPTIEGGRWVRAEALVLGDSVIRHIVDGDTVLTYGRVRLAPGVVAGHDPAQLVPDRPLGRGHLALQAEGHPIDFRNVRLLNLEGCTDPRAATYRRYHVRSDPAACRYDR